MGNTTRVIYPKYLAVTYLIIVCSVLNVCQRNLPAKSNYLNIQACYSLLFHLFLVNHSNCSFSFLQVDRGKVGCPSSCRGLVLGSVRLTILHLPLLLTAQSLWDFNRKPKSFTKSFKQQLNLNSNNLSRSQPASRCAIQKTLLYFRLNLL